MEKSIFALFFGSPDHEFGGVGVGGSILGHPIAQAKKSIACCPTHSAYEYESSKMP